MKRFITIAVIMCLSILFSLTCYSQAPVIYSPGVQLNNKIGPGENMQPVTVVKAQNVITQQGHLLIDNKETILQSSKISDIDHGITRLVKIIKDKYNDDTCCESISTSGGEGRWTIQIANCSRPLLNGFWQVSVYPAESIYEVAPKGGFWYGLYDSHMTRLGTCQAYRIK